MNEEDASEQSVVIFADGFEGAISDQIDPNDEGQQHLSIGDDGITIVVTPENEQQVSELLRALQAQHGGEDVQILTEAAPSGEEVDQEEATLLKIKEEEEYIAADGDKFGDSGVKRKRGRPPKGSPAEGAGDANKKAKLIELAMQEAEASMTEGVSSLKSSRLREKAAKQGGLKKLWLTGEESEEELLNVENDRPELRSDGEEIHKCEECPEMEFASLEDLKDHRKDVHRAAFHCEICGIGFEDQIGFFEHLKTHYDKPQKRRGRPRKAAGPSISTASVIPGLKSGGETSEGQLTCDTCHKEFRNSKALDAHVRNAHPDAITKAYHCAQCNTSFRYKEAMETHLENVHGVSSGEGGSGAEAASSSSLFKVESMDGASGSVDADLIGLEDGEGELDAEHEEMGEEEHGEEDGDEEGEDDDDDKDDGEEDMEALQASGVTDYDPAIDGHCCQLCGAVFSAKKRLIQHLKEDHHIGFRRGRRPKYPPVETAEDGTFPCPVCKRSFTHKNSLAYHVRTHAGDRPHQCEICGKSFFANGALKVHMRVHTGARPYKCEVCGREFRQWGDLKYHFTSLHSGVRQYQCEFCGKSFARKYSLIVHRRVHTGERNYKCEFCGKGFRASSYLLNHRRIHTGEKPHPCPVCFKPFRMRSDMKRHMQMHARDGSDVSLLLACAEQGIDPLDAISADPEALAALREKASLSAESGAVGKRGERSRRGTKHGKSEEAAAVATIQDEDDEEGSVMLTIVPNEDGEMVAVPVHVGTGDDDHTKMAHVEGVDHGDSQEGTVQELHLINEDGEVQEGLEAVTMRDPNTNTLYVWSVFPNTPMK